MHVSPDKRFLSLSRQHRLGGVVKEQQSQPSVSNIIEIG
jgi:hypothetical protein